MLKSLTMLLAGLLIWGCVKDPNPSILKSTATDYRDSITGNYNGIRIETAATGTASIFTHDTTSVILTLSKSITDSLIDISFNPAIGVQPYTFKYRNHTYTQVVTYHAASLRKSSDSFYFHHQPALGPYWNDCNVKKQ